MGWTVPALLPIGRGAQVDTTIRAAPLMNRGGGERHGEPGQRDARQNHAGGEQAAEKDRNRAQCNRSPRLSDSDMTPRLPPVNEQLVYRPAGGGRSAHNSVGRHRPRCFDRLGRESEREGS